MSEAAADAAPARVIALGSPPPDALESLDADGDGPVVVLSADASWGAAVSDRNRAGRRTALLIGDPDDPDARNAAAEMAAELFRTFESQTT